MLTEDQVKDFTKILLSQTKQLARVADALEIIARNTAPEAPNYQRPIGEYASFDWDSIGAEITDRDDDGPTVVSWGDFTWLRRSPQNKFAEAIWFSRPIGKNADGQVRYARLITFKTASEAEPIPAKVARAVEAGAEAPHNAPPAPAPSQPAPAPQRAPRPAHVNGKPKYDPLKDERLKGLEKPSLALDLPGVVVNATLFYHLAKLFDLDKPNETVKAAGVWAEAKGDATQAIRALDFVVTKF